MNIQRIISTLVNVNAALQTPWRFSADQLKTFRRSKRKLNKELKAMVDPKATARPLPQSPQATQLKLI